jgi:hypothetical protein
MLRCLCGTSILLPIDLSTRRGANGLDQTSYPLIVKSATWTDHAWTQETAGITANALDACSASLSGRLTLSSTASGASPVISSQTVSECRAVALR